MIQRQKGFTIVELLIVIIVIAILAAIATVAFNGIKARAIESEKSTKLTNIYKLILNYHTINGTYPGNSQLSGSSGAALLGLTLKDVEPSDRNYPGNGIETGGDADAGTRHIRYIAAQNPDGSGFSCGTQPCGSFSLSYYDRVANQTVYLRSPR